MAIFAPLATPTRRAGYPIPALLHVTDVLPFTGDRNSPAIIAACARGHAVHKVCEDYDRGEPSLVVEPEYSGYFDAWKKFLAVTDAKVIEIEAKITNTRLGYVGRLDRVLDIGKRRWIVDIKTGPTWPTHGPQLAAYAAAYSDVEVARACVHLAKDGTYKLKVHDSIHDWPTFKAYLRIAYFEIATGLREPPAARD